MPLYELLCLAKPNLPRAQLSAMLQNVGRTIMDNGGVLTDVRSYGVQWLAYTVRKPFEKYDQAHIWQMNFMAGPQTVRTLDGELGREKGALRWMTVKRADKATVPQLEQILREQQAQREAQAQAALGAETAEVGALAVEERPQQPPAQQ